MIYPSKYAPCQSSVAVLRILSMSGLFVLTFLLLITTFATAQDIEAGRRAANARKFQVALREWQPLAEEGNPEAQFLVGRLYANGDGVRRDFAQARHWFELSSEQGYAAATSRLGMMYRYGDGVEKNLIKAAQLFATAADAGDLTAQKNLAELKKQGINIADLNGPIPTAVTRPSAVRPRTESAAVFAEPSEPVMITRAAATATPEPSAEAASQTSEATNPLAAFLAKFKGAGGSKQTPGPGFGN